ncbi:BamA/TamA family outer membrane protein [Flaviaesturariibacter flavus]|uniref:BamA/TamA family outer membrane protein n=1 Tax=Flaviaesturariibacter flavus TaxID=2502780 RepID=UPI0014052F09|nr:BamA/TamA family outer membrane protein [Flaviaesturariibacter flavus]
MRTKVQQTIAGILLMLVAGVAHGQFAMRYRVVDSAAHNALPPLEARFTGRNAALNYLARLPESLQAQGYVSASVDSLALDSSFAAVSLFLGSRYQWARIYTSAGDEDLFTALRWNARSFERQPVDFARLHALQERLLARLDETGYPFARVGLDSISIDGVTVAARLHIDRGMLYAIDSIRVYGDLRISNELLQKHLNLPNGTPYSKSKLQSVDKRLAELPYLQVERPSDLTMLNTGSVLNVYLKNKKNNQVNALVGFLPNPDANATKKLLVTGEANLLLRNALGGGESLGLNWQQLQQSSPRLHLLFEQPYFLRSPIGIAVDFEMFRKDTTFLNLIFDVAARYRSGNGIASVFFQRRSTVVNGISEAALLSTRRLPAEANVRSNNLGVGYEWNGTDYRPNPRRGTAWRASGSAGIKNIRQNAAILALKDPNDPSFSFARLYDTVQQRTYQFRASGAIEHFIPVGRQGTFRTALSAGAFFSGNVFRNELFQVGGYKLLRGFDEESEYLQHFAVGTVEYRILLDQNSNFFTFLDAAWGHQPAPVNADRFYLGTGLGISFETKAGVFNLALALGRRDDIPFNLRRSKVHIGFVSYF